MRPLVGFPATGAMLLVAAAAVTRWTDLLPWAFALCLATYAAGLLARGDALDLLAPLFAAGVVLAAELAYWSLESPTAPDTPAAVVRRAGVVLASVAGTAALGSVLLAAARIRPAGGPLVLALGVGAAIAALALLAGFARMRER